MHKRLPGLLRFIRALLCLISGLPLTSNIQLDASMRSCTTQALKWREPTHLHVVLEDLREPRTSSSEFITLGCKACPLRTWCALDKTRDSYSSWKASCNTYNEENSIGQWHAKIHFFFHHLFFSQNFTEVIFTAFHSTSTCSCHHRSPRWTRSRKHLPAWHHSRCGRQLPEISFQARWIIDTFAQIITGLRNGVD